MSLKNQAALLSRLEDEAASINCLEECLLAVSGSKRKTWSFTNNIVVLQRLHAKVFISNSFERMTLLDSDYTPEYLAS